MRLSPVAVLLASLVLPAAPAALAAQGSTLEGGSVERLLGQGGDAVAFTYRRTEASRQGLGIDLAVGFFPAALAGRTVRMQVDAGFARIQWLGPAALILKGGFGSLLDVGPAPEIIPGLQAGVAAVVRLDHLCGLRVDLTRRVLFPDGQSYSLWSLGLGLSLLPGHRGAP